MIPGAITVQEAARRLGVDDSRIRKLIKKKIISAEKFGDKSWAVDPVSVEKYGATPRKAGHPRKQKEEQPQ
jgi:excisionase family DNA binding protein